MEEGKKRILSSFSVLAQTGSGKVMDRCDDHESLVDDSSDLEESWAGEDVMLDNSPVSRE